MRLARIENQESRRNNREASLDSRLNSRFLQGSRIECQLTFERYCTGSHPSHYSCIMSHPSRPSLIFVLSLLIPVTLVILVMPVIPATLSHPSHHRHTTARQYVSQSDRRNRGYYMAARRYEISFRVLKNISRVSAANE